MVATRCGSNRKGSKTLQLNGAGTSCLIDLVRTLDIGSRNHSGTPDPCNGLIYASKRPSKAIRTSPSPEIFMTGPVRVTPNQVDSGILSEDDNSFGTLDLIQQSGAIAWMVYYGIEPRSHCASKLRPMLALMATGKTSLAALSVPRPRTAYGISLRFTALHGVLGLSKNNG